MKNYQLLWKPKVEGDAKYEKLVSLAKNRLTKLVKRPWQDVRHKLTRLRYYYRKAVEVSANKQQWMYFNEMAESFPPCYLSDTVVSFSSLVLS